MTPRTRRAFHYCRVPVKRRNSSTLFSKVPISAGLRVVLLPHASMTAGFWLRPPLRGLTFASLTLACAESWPSQNALEQLAHFCGISRGANAARLHDGGFLASAAASRLNLRFAHVSLRRKLAVTKRS
jgi:hypothetical protein